MSERGRIIKALSGFYYVDTGERVIECRARGKFRLDGSSPLVGDKVAVTLDAQGRGRVDEIEPRRNFFIRPAVANIDAMVFIAANVNPVTDPFLIDRVTAVCSAAGCECIVCINKSDLDAGDELYATYTSAGFTAMCVSAATGQGTETLRAAIRGKLCAFTGNSGVGKSSILNALVPGLDLPVGEVSDRLGRGRHTTRHVELFPLGEDTFVADTPGFATFDVEMINSIEETQLQYHFIDFEPYIGSCRFSDCAHLREPGCAVTEAVFRGDIAESRYRSYERLYELSARHKSWEDKTK